jgi:S-adenosylmethionine decarboxylase
MTNSTYHFGVHLTIDGYGGNPEKLNDKELVLKCLAELPEKIGTHILGGPEVYWAEEGHTKDPGGWSGFVVIAESHISIHTFPKRCFVSADVYTCNADGFDQELVISYIKEAFDLTDIEVNMIKRGTRYPSCNISAS